MQKEIKYIGYYSPHEIMEESRTQSLAAANKMDYICEVLTKLGYWVTIVSPSITANRKYYCGKTIMRTNMSIVVFSTFPWGNKIQKAFSLLYSQLALFIYLIKNTKKGESLLCYHSLSLMTTVLLAKKIKKFNLILEVEEIYQDVKVCSFLTKRNEYRIFNCADKYLFSTELLRQKLNQENKPSLIAYGTYKVEADRKYRSNDGKIHVVYAGVIDSQKRGSLTAVKVSTYLDSNYHIHIIGFGNEKDKKTLQDLIQKISEFTECKVTYDGLLKGEEYIQFLQNCDIGLSTQTTEGSYNETSFPSKVLSYLANGLRVVSIRIKAIEQSQIGNMIYFYDNDVPEDVAKAIKSIDFGSFYDSRKRIQQLDSNFAYRMSKLLG